jgi:hypothetical protein
MAMRPQKVFLALFFIVLNTTPAPLAAVRGLFGRLFSGWSKPDRPFDDIDARITINPVVEAKAAAEAEETATAEEAAAIEKRLASCRKRRIQRSRRNAIEHSQPPTFFDDEKLIKSHEALIAAGKESRAFKKRDVYKIIRERIEANPSRPDYSGINATDLKTYTEKETAFRAAQENYCTQLALIKKSWTNPHQTSRELRYAQKALIRFFEQKTLDDTITPDERKRITAENCDRKSIQNQILHNPTNPDFRSINPRLVKQYMDIKSRIKRAKRAFKKLSEDLALDEEYEKMRSEVCGTGAGTGSSITATSATSAEGHRR